MPATVSVVLNFFRAEFFHQAIASVLGQTRLPEEILVVNDGAAPADAEHLQRYRGLPQVKIIDQPNRGLAVARNHGIAEATGDWIAFLDDDDVWEPDRLRILCDYIDAHPECEAIHNAILMMETDVVHRKKELTLSDFLTTFPPPSMPSATMIRRTRLLQAGMHNPALRIGQDWDTCLRVAITSRFHYVDLPLTQRRRHAHNITRQFMKLILVCNQIVFFYRDFYSGPAEYRHFARSMNAGFLARAFYGRDWTAARRILQLAPAHQLSRAALLLWTLGELVGNRLKK
jgi:glycosyltransferase involved in cell wall biosynthesis